MEYGGIDKWRDAHWRDAGDQRSHQTRVRLIAGRQALGTVKLKKDAPPWHSLTLTITYEKRLEIYFQNPQFGYYFLVLTSQRLLENISRLEGVVAQEKALRRTTAAGDIA
jgi:hypothetical protein